ncbi:MAG: sulfatase, partial [Bacteroidaceae bacterium]|nr:sulfatase [Bacteroidaceae bacterium]
LSSLAPTPNIDRLARRGMLFNNCFVENSLSAPSRACLITGLYSHQNGQRQLFEGIDSSKTFFTELLQQAGYTTGLVGKWHLRTEPKGFDYFHVFDDQGKYYNPTFCTTGDFGNYKQEMGYATTLVTQHAIEYLDNRDKSKPFCLMVHHKAPHRNWMPDTKNIGKYADVVFPLPETFYDDYATRGSAAHTQKMNIAHAMEMIQDLKVPELLEPDNIESMTSYNSLMGELGRLTPEQRAAWDKYYLPRNRAFMEAHLTGNALTEWKYQNYVRDYMAVIQSVDESVGQLLDYLEQHNLDENTIVVYTSDQGFYMGEHGWFDKRFMYEESMHTPLIVSYPGHIKEGSVCNQMVQNIDFAPTFLSLAGVQKPREMTGLSLEPLFAGTPVKKWRESMYYHYYDYPTFHLVRKHDGVRTDRYKLIHFYGKGGERAVSENKYQNMDGTTEKNIFMYLKYSNYFQDDADVDYYELYDLQTDPHELNNIYGQKGMEKETKKLMKLLTQYRETLQVDEY